MEKKQLKATLAALRADLESGAEIDPELKQLLETLDVDINRLLGKDQPDPETVAGIGARLNAAATKFTAEHPKIAPILRELADTLGRMGI